MYIEKVEKILKDVRYWECKKINVKTNNISVWNGKIYDITASETSAFSIRILYKNGWGFATTSLPLNSRNIEIVIKNALKNAKISNKFSKRKIDVYTNKAIKDAVKTKTKIFPLDVSLDEKVNLLFDYDKEINDKRIRSKFFTYSDRVLEKKFVSSEGSDITQEDAKVVISTEMMAEENGRRETNFAKYAKTGGFEITNNFEVEINETANCLFRMLKGKNVNGGNFPVVADGTLTAVIIHEALGHAAEGDAIIQGRSCLGNLIKKEISSKINVVDDPTIEGLFGSFFYDDEGVKAGKKYILKDGVLENFLHSRETAVKFKSIPGNARAQGNSIPLVRMSNTFIEPQDYELNEMISGIKDGFYLKGSRGGEVDITKGTFQFYAKECYKVKNGEIDDMLKGVSLMGNIFDVLKNIDAVGKKEFASSSPGICGKGGQNVAVDGINPAVRIRSILIGSI